LSAHQAIIIFVGNKAPSAQYLIFHCSCLDSLLPALERDKTGTHRGENAMMAINDRNSISVNPAMRKPVPSGGVLLWCNPRYSRFRA